MKTEKMKKISYLLLTVFSCNSMENNNPVETFEAIFANTNKAYDGYIYKCIIPETEKDDPWAFLNTNNIKRYKSQDYLNTRQDSLTKNIPKYNIQNWKSPDTKLIECEKIKELSNEKNIIENFKEPKVNLQKIEDRKNNLMNNNNKPTRNFNSPEVKEIFIKEFLSPNAKKELMQKRFKR